MIAELGWVAAIFAALTVFSTSMIYAQLKTVPRWHSVLTPLHLLSLSAAGGALLAAQVSLAFWVMLGAGATQILYWLWGDYALHRSGSTTATATQLGDNTRAFEPPHTGSNYLTKEMVYVVARKHRYKLRLIALGLGYILPLILLGMTGDAHLFGFLAVLSHAIGVSVSRWLFFAEAEHVVGLYYGLR